MKKIKLMKVTYIYRKRRSGNFSIELLFDIISKSISKKLVVTNVELPFFSNGIIRRLLNIIYVAFLQSDVFHITGDVHYVALLLPPKKTVLTIHDCGPLAYGTGVKSFIYKYLWLKIPCSRVAVITTVSEKTKEDLIEFCGVSPDKIHVVNNFFDPNLEVDEKILKARSCKLPHDRKKSILTIGTKDNKNLPRIIEAASRLDLIINILGSLTGELKDKLKEFDVEYFNYTDVSKEKLICLYIKSDILMFPSTFEGFGLPIIEAQILKTPVVTSDIEPMKSIGGNGAIFVDPFSVNSIVQGTQKILNSLVDVDALIVSGYENAKKYSLESVVEKYMFIYMLLNERQVESS